MVNTVADNQSIALGDTTAQKKSQVDLLNIQLNNDIYNLGYGSAILKNWGQPGDSVSQAKLRHYGALPGETLQDAKYRYYAAAASLYPPRTNITDDPQGLRSTAGTGLGSAPHWITGRFPTDVTYSNITGQVGPLANLTTAARLTWTTTAGSDRGWHISGNAGQATNVGYFGWPVVPGQTVSASAWFRGTWAGTVPSGWWSYSFYDSANNRIGIQNLGTPYVLTKGVWVRASFSAIVPANATFLECYFAIVTTGNPLTTIGDTLDGTGLLCENNAPKSAVDGVSVAPYFDGSTTNAVWNGTAGASTSTTANGTAGYSSNPTIYPPRTNISIDPQGLRNDAIISAGNGPHWLSNRFATDEAYSSLTGIVGPLASLTTAQRITWKTTNGVSRGWHISGNTDTTTGNTYNLWSVVPGQTVTISAWFRGQWAGTIPTGAIYAYTYDSSGNAIGARLNSTITTLSNGVWLRISLAATIPAAGAWFGASFTLATGAVTTIGDTLDGTGLLCENNAPSNAIGGGIAPYFDGSSQNAYWTGATQNSSSITPDGTAGYLDSVAGKPLAILYGPNAQSVPLGTALTGLTGRTMYVVYVPSQNTSISDIIASHDTTANISGPNQWTIRLLTTSPASYDSVARFAGGTTGFNQAPGTPKVIGQRQTVCIWLPDGMANMGMMIGTNADIVGSATTPGTGLSGDEFRIIGTNADGVCKMAVLYPVMHDRPTRLAVAAQLLSMAPA